MDINPYQSPNVASEAEPLDVEEMACPECGESMQPGYVTAPANVFFRKWTNKSWFLSKPLSGTHPALVGFNKLGGYRCACCELVIFRHGAHQRAYAPTDLRDTPCTQGNQSP